MYEVTPDSIQNADGQKTKLVEQTSMSNSPIRSVVTKDIPAIKDIIDSTELFPSELLDHMFEEDSDPASGFWITYDITGPVAVSYVAPEPMTSGTYNLLLIAVHKNSQSAGIGQDRTRQFYELRGYENEARIRDYYDIGDDKVVFRKVL